MKTIARPGGTHRISRLSVASKKPTGNVVSWLSFSVLVGDHDIDRKHGNV